MKWIKSYNIEELKQMAQDFVEREYDYEDAELHQESLEHMYEFIESDYPYGLQNIPSSFVLYRIIAKDENEELNLDNLGQHFVSQKELLMDKSFLSSIDFDIYKYDEAYIVAIEANEQDINWYETIRTKALFSDEGEFWLQPRQYKVLDVEEVYLGQ